MGKGLEFKRHIFLKCATTMIISILCLLTLNEWDRVGVGTTGGFLLLFNIVFTVRKRVELNTHFIKTVRIVVNYVFITALLYFTNMTLTGAYIPFYFYMITVTTFSHGIKVGSLVGIVSLAVSLVINNRFDLYSILNLFFLYGSALTLGYFIYLEDLRNETLNQKVRELGALDKISRIIDEFPETQELLSNITRVVAETMDYRASVIMFYDEEKKRLVAKAGYGLSLDMLRYLAREQSFERKVIENKEAILTNEDKEEGIIHLIKAEGEPESIQFRVAIPLMFRNRVIGTLSLYDESKSILKGGDKSLLHLMGSRIGIVLENDRLYKELKYNSITDGLTGLYNHKQFYERLKYEIEHAEKGKSKLYLLMIDIDRFKGFNDQFGHLVGDKVLVEVAKTIKNSIRETDVAARYGGEEFAIILPHASQETVGVVADRIRYNVKKILHGVEETRGHDVEITVSIGIACFPNCSNDLANLVDIADLRMYKGKELGGDRVIA